MSAARAASRLRGPVSASIPALEQTIAQYNAAVDAGTTAQLTPARSVSSHKAWPVRTAPFYAARLCAGITYTMGGIAIVAATVLGCVPVFLVPGVLPFADTWVPVPLAALAMFVVGVLDDRLQLSPTAKLVASLVVGALLVFVLARNEPGGLPWWLTIVSIVWFAGLCHAVNLLDNMDGLCAGITLYNPLAKAKVGPGMRVGVMGLGGLGHMGVKLAVAMGAAAQQKLVVYTSNDSTLNDLVFADFKKKTGIEVEVVAAGSGVVMRRLQAEKAHPLGDIVWGVSRSLLQTNKAYFQPYASANKAATPAEYRDPDDLWIGNNLHLLVILQNTRLVPEDQGPKTWADLLDPKWKGKIAFTDPANSGSAYQTVTLLVDLWGGGDAGWKKVGMSDLVLPQKCKIVYMKAIAKVHPDKVSGSPTLGMLMREAS